MRLEYEGRIKELDDIKLEVLKTQFEIEAQILFLSEVNQEKLRQLQEKTQQNRAQIEDLDLRTQDALRRHTDLERELSGVRSDTDHSEKVRFDQWLRITMDDQREEIAVARHEEEKKDLDQLIADKQQEVERLKGELTAAKQQFETKDGYRQAKDEQQQYKDEMKGSYVESKILEARVMELQDAEKTYKDL